MIFQIYTITKLRLRDQPYNELTFDDINTIKIMSTMYGYNGETSFA